MRGENCYSLAMSETQLETSQRHVLEGRKHIARQFEIIDKLESNGFPTDEAERLLRTFEDTQDMHEAHLAHLLGLR